MENIQFLPSLAIDALCFITRCYDNEKWIPVSHNFEKDKIIDNPLFREQFDQIEFFKKASCIQNFNHTYDISSMALLFSAYTDNKLENTSLDDIIDILKDIDILEKIVKKKITNDFNSSCTSSLIDILKSGMSADMIDILRLMKENGFEHNYNKRILPFVKKDIELNKSKIEKYDTISLFSQIAKLKNKNVLPCIKIFITFFSLPYAFALYNGAFSMCYTGNTSVDFFSITAHELMHGFADNELIKMYHSYIESDEYLSEMHAKLHTQFGSGDEEEFVKASEYYLCFLSGKYSREKLMTRAKAEYDGTCPISVILFDLLLREKNCPVNYNFWIKKQFSEKQLPQSNIKEFIENL